MKMRNHGPVFKILIVLTSIAFFVKSANAGGVTANTPSTTSDRRTYVSPIRLEGNTLPSPFEGEPHADDANPEQAEAPTILDKENEAETGKQRNSSVVDQSSEGLPYTIHKPLVESFLKDKVKPIIISPFPKPPFPYISVENEKIWTESKKEYLNISAQDDLGYGVTEEEDTTVPPSEATLTTTDSSAIDSLSSESTERPQTTLTSTSGEHSTDSVLPTVFGKTDLQVPLCCLGGRDGVESCHKQSESLHLVPIAFSHCYDPVNSLVKFNTTTNLCPERSLKKVILNKENKLIYRHRKMFFYWNMVFIDGFCLEDPSRANDPLFKVLVCSSAESSRHPEQCIGGVCHTKCCPEGYLLQKEYCVCYDDHAQVIEKVVVKRTHKRGLLSGIDKHVKFPKCERPHVITGNSSGIKNGLKFGENESEFIITDPSLDYCVDRILDVQEGRNIVSTNLAAVVCPQIPQVYESTWAVVRRVLIPLGLVVSCVFLAATLLCHLFLPALRDLRGLYLTAYVASLLVADSALFTTQAFAQFLAPASCVSLALILHVAFLSTFFWLNVICYDVWTYVRLSVQGVPLHRTHDDMTRFLVRAGYAWGCPFLIGIVAAVMQLVPMDDDEYLRPNFVENRCWFRDGEEILAYFYGPMGILCVVNTLLILHTGIVLYCANNRCHCFFGSCGQTNHTFDRQHLNEFWQRFGLFAIMASCWLTEVISSIVGSGDSELWAVTDTLNTFQGVFIFITFIRSTKRRRLVQEKLESWMERVERGGLPAPNLPSSIRPGNVISRLRNSRVWTSLAGMCGSTSCRRTPHLSSKQVLDNIIFKEKVEDRKGFNNQAFEEERDEGPMESSFSRDSSINRAAAPIWTIPRWTSLRSRTYFPNDIGNRAANNDSPQQDNDIICENFADSLSIYSTYSQDGNQRSSSLDYQQTQRPIFTQWNLLRLKSGSLDLSLGDLTGKAADGGSGDVICQGLTRKNSLSKK